MKYKNHKQALAVGGSDVWPGCGYVGRCMPCGHIHHFAELKMYRCLRHHNDGCPDKIPKPQHTWTKARISVCTVCGAQRGWLAPDGRWFRTTKLAKEAGFKRINLKFGNGRPRIEPFKSKKIKSQNNMEK